VTTPRAGVVRAFAAAALRLSLLFGAVFYGIDAFTTTRTRLWRLHFDWELVIPYWPAAYLVYYSVLALPFVVLWLAPDADAVRDWERRMALAVVVAGGCFLAFPARLGFAPADAAAWQALARATDWLAGRHNLLPSLHVGLTGVILLAVWPQASARVRRALLAWAAALTASTLLTHQHHVIDLVAGAVLAVAVSWRLRPRVSSTP
jgi:PAP2 superfamily